MDDPRELVHAILKMVNDNDLDRAEELIHEDYVDHPGGGMPDMHGPEGFRQIVAMFRAGFPDMEVRPEEVIVEGDLAAWRTVGTGTNTGELMGMPATGKRVTFTALDMGRMQDGKAIEHWSGVDMVGMMQQLGMMPEMGKAAG
ncbi:MAG TPA: ester cyclase [Actinomycetota bacterium]|nr:ester cyclase [Actinomycetota bacterium]